MRKLALALAFLALMAPTQIKAETCHGLWPGQRLVPFAFETLTVSTTAVLLTDATFKPGSDSNDWADVAFMSVEDDSIRFRLSGTPTATVGHQISAGDAFTICGGADVLDGFSVIRSGSADAEIQVTYYRVR